LKKIENLNEDTEGKPENFILPGNPLSVEELKERVMNAHNAVINGEFITHQDLLKEMNSW